MAKPRTPDKQATIRLNDEIRKQIVETGKEDFRDFSSQARYLIALGLKTREQIESKRERLAIG